MPTPPINPLVVSQFDGGITDNYLDADINQYEDADNLLVKNSKKFETRSGTSTYSTSYYQVAGGAIRIGSMFNLDDQFFQLSGRNVYFYSGSAQTLTGASSNPALPLGDTTNYASFGEWNKHLILTSDAFGSPQKIYKDSAGTFRVRTAGLPKVTLTACIALANDLKSKINAHLTDTSEHTAGADNTNTITSDDAYDFPTLVTLVTEMLTDYDAHEGDAELASAWLYHAAQEAGDRSLTTTVAPETLSDCKTRLDDLKSKYNSHDADGTAHGTDSEYQSSKYSQPQISGGTTASSQYIYTFVAKYTYTVGSVTFVDRGPTHSITLPELTVPSSSLVSISEIPVIANSTRENYDTSNIKWEIYRTAQNGTSSYYLNEVTNGTTTYSDSATDASINTNSQVYTAGGVKDNDPPPNAKFVVVVNDITWYGHVKEGASVRKSRIRQSQKFDPDSCPESFFIDLEDEITGMGYVGIYPIAFCKRHIYRIEGFKDEFGRGIIQKREISRTVGSVNHLGIVNSLEGIFFPGNDGFYFTDGFQVVKLSEEFSTRYGRIVTGASNKAKIYGKYSPKDKRIYWAVSDTASDDENTRLYVLDLKFPIGARSVFTTITATSQSWIPTALEVDPNEDLVIGDTRGYLFKFDSGRRVDPKVDTSTTPDNWLSQAITYDYKGPGINFGSYIDRKYPTWITVIQENPSSISLSIQSKNDDSGFWQELKEIRYRDNFAWLDFDAPSWLSDDVIAWNIFPMIGEKRRFPQQALRCIYKQIRLTNATTVIYKSDNLGTATVNATAKTVSLNSHPSQTWVDDITDYFISFEDDSYTENYDISTRSSSQVIIYVDNQDQTTSGSLEKFVIRGVKKRERLNLISYAIHWDQGSNSNATYRGETGGNA